MNFGFTDEQDLLRAEVRKLLDERCPLTEVRRIAEAPEGYDPVLFGEMAQLGWLGLLVPETHGGAGLSWPELVVLLEEAGRSLHPAPLLGTMLSVLAIREHGSDDQQRRWLPAIAQAEALFSVALQEADDRLEADAIALTARKEGDAVVLQGEKLFVPDARSASHFVVSARGEENAFCLAVVEAGAPGVEVFDLPAIDPTKRLGKVVFEAVRVSNGDLMATSPARLERLYDQAAAAVVAEAIGAAEAVVALTCDYARSREQFGSPIGRFQGVKHPLAEMYVDIESFKSILYYAAWCLDERPEDVARHVSMAKALASDAFTRIGIDAIQLHGALGYTWEYDAQLYLKRSKWVKAMFGGSDHHYARVAALGES